MDANALWSQGMSATRGTSTVTAPRDRRALVDHIAATLQSRVLRGEIAGGTRLRQEGIAAEFGVSRTPVREALRKLQAGGVVELTPHRGAVVRDPNTRDIREAYAVRAELEGYAAELAAQRIRDAQLQVLRDSVALFRSSMGSLIERRRDGAGSSSGADVEEWTRANDAFHQGVLDAAGNARLRTLLTELHLSFPRNLTGIVLSESSALIQENVEQHAAVLDAIERRDPLAARRLMAEHVRRAGELVTFRFEQQAS